jgi:hypothetical protein
MRPGKLCAAVRAAGAASVARATLAVCLACAAAAVLAPARLAAQVPVAIAAQNRAMGVHMDLAAALRLYAPLQERAPYRGVRVRRDVAYGASRHERLDLFVPTSPPAQPLAGRDAARLRPVLVFAPPQADAQRALGPGRRAFDSVALWAARHGLVGVTMQRRDDLDSPWPSGPQDFAAMAAWMQAHLREVGGDPQRVLVVGAGFGGTQLLGYLAHHEYWCCRGPGVAAVALIAAPLNLPGASGSAAMPNAAAAAGGPTGTLLDPAHSDLRGLDIVYVPVFIASARYQSDAAGRSATVLQQELCRRGRCPTLRYLVDHNVLSAMLSFDTADESVSRQLLAWMQAQHLQ